MPEIIGFVQSIMIAPGNPSVGCIAIGPSRNNVELYRVERKQNEVSQIADFKNRIIEQAAEAMRHDEPVKIFFPGDRVIQTLTINPI